MRLSREHLCIDFAYKFQAKPCVVYDADMLRNKVTFRTHLDVAKTTDIYKLDRVETLAVDYKVHKLSTDGT